VDDAALLAPAPRLALMLGGPGVDGAAGVAEEAPSTWRQAEHFGQVEPAGEGLRFFDDPAPLVERAGASGVDEVFLRLSWARLLRPGARLDLAGLDRYVEIVRHLRAKGLRVSVVLFDGLVPECLGAEAWLVPSTPGHFVDYAGQVIEALGHDIESIMSFEEPATSALAGWVLGDAPPFRRFAIADAMAALDAMMASHLGMVRLVHDQLPALSTSFAASTRRSSMDLEALVLGEKVSTGSKTVLERWIPGRARRAAQGLETALDERYVVAGQGPGPRTAVARSLARLALAPVELGGPGGLGALLAAGGAEEPGRVSLLLRHVAVQIDQQGHRTALRGALRVRELRAALDAAARAADRGVAVERIVVGELTDRWTSGSYRWREGFLGVDRSPGIGRATLLETDAAGLDALGELNRYVVNAR
jgi:hypothetical protein